MRLFKYLPLLLLPVMAMAQSTHPVTYSFPILQPRVSQMQKGLSGFIPTSVSLWGRNSALDIHAYSPNKTDGIDSVYFPHDSLANLQGETVYWIRVDSVGTSTTVTTDTASVRASADTILYIWVDKRALGIDSATTKTVWKNSTNRNIIDDLGIAFESNVAAGDEIKIAMTHDTPISVDHTTHSLIVTDHRESELHEGNSYTVFSDSTLPASTDTTAICIVTPGGAARLHLDWLADVDAKSYFIIKTGITVGAATDTLSILNDDYGSSKTSSVIALANPRSGNTGTEVYKRLIGSTNRAGGFAKAFGHRVLARNTKYTFLVTSLSGATITTIILSFEEHIEQ